MARISVIGMGYVGLVTAACFADLGNEVWCVELDGRKIELLQQNRAPFYEPGLEELIARNAAAGRLRFTDRYEEAIPGSNFVFICVGTPMAENGAAELKYVRMAAESIGPNLRGRTIIVNKSTVPIGTGDMVTEILSRYADPSTFAVVSNPEFLREGSAVNDFFNPDRIVLGANDRRAAEEVAELHAPLNAPVIITDLHTAEMIKYASNAFLATRISFINEIAHICERLGADVKEVARGMGMDRRIGPHFLNAGVGFGGSCFAGSETVFLVNPPSVQPRTLAEMFEALESGDVTPDGLEVRYPSGWYVCSFDLAAGQPVVTPILCLTRRPYDGVMVRLQTRMGRKIEVTADHPIPVYRLEKGEWEIVPASEVREGDLLATPMASFPLPPVRTLYLLQQMAGHPLADDVLVRPLDDRFRRAYHQILSAIPPSQMSYPYDIARRNYMPLRVYGHLRQQGYFPQEDERALQLYTTKGRPTYCPAVFDLDERFLRMVGYYLAEGWITVDVGRHGRHRERVAFAFGRHEREYLADLEDILTSYHIRFHRRISGNSTALVVSSRVLAWLLRDALRCGVNSYDKRLPPFALALDEAGRLALLRGIFSGDGAVSQVNRGRHICLEYATASPVLAQGVALLLQSLGVVPSLVCRRMNRSRVPGYVIRIAGEPQVAQMAPLFGPQKEREILSLCGQYRRIMAPLGFQRHGPLALLPVTSVSFYHGREAVFSLETGNGLFVGSDGLIVHNCFPKDVRALAYMAKAQDCHPQLLQAVLEINDDARRRFVAKLVEMLGELPGRTVGVLGLSFKPNTDDMREAPSIEIITCIHELGAQVKAYDPVAMPRAEEILPWVTYCATPYDVAKGADALLVITEWNEFKQLNMERIRDLMRQPVLLDGRNVYEPAEMRRLGFRYYGVGRP